MSMTLERAATIVNRVSESPETPWFQAFALILQDQQEQIDQLKAELAALKEPSNNIRGWK